jgi:hypothetical protein
MQFSQPKRKQCRIRVLVSFAAMKSFECVRHFKFYPKQIFQGKKLKIVVKWLQSKWRDRKTTYTLKSKVHTRSRLKNNQPHSKKLC